MQPASGVFEPREDLGLRFDEFDNLMNRQGFIASRVMPIVTRSNPTGKFPRVNIDQVLQNLDTKRNPDGTYKRSKREFSDDNFETMEHGLEATLDDRTVARYNDLIDAEMYEGDVIENSLLLDYEKEIAAHQFNTTTYAGRTSAVGVAWSVFATALPVTDVLAQKHAIKLQCGRKPNALIINDEVLDWLIQNDQIIQNLKYQGFQDARAGNINAAAVAISMNIDEVIVAEGVANTMAPGVDAVLTDIWSNDYALLAVVAKTSNPMEVCIGRTFMWDQEGATDGNGMGVIAETYYEEARRGGVLRRRTDWGRKDLFLQAGYLMTGIAA